MPDNQEEKIITRFKSIRTRLALNQIEFAELVNIKQSQVSAIEAGRRNITSEIKLKLEDSIKVNRNWLETGQGDMFNVAKTESNAILIGKVPGPEETTEMTPLGNNEYGIVVPLIPFKAWAGYLDNFGDMEYMETLQKHNVTVTGSYRGRYFAFVVEGESMENYSTPELGKQSIPNGTIVTAREIQKHHWRTKLHLHRFKNYVIVTHDGIIAKEIIEHNTEEGYIICHSLNPKWADKKLMLDDCVQILNIVRRELPE